MSASISPSPLYIKSGVSAVTSAVLCKYIAGDELMPAVYFGAATGAGSLVGGMISSYIPEFFPDSPGMWQGGAVQDRVLEVGGAVAAGALLNRYTQNNSNATFSTKLMIVFASNFVGEYVSDYITTQPLAYLQ